MEKKKMILKKKILMRMRKKRTKGPTPATSQEDGT
jgi:hypothetical protein